MTGQSKVMEDLRERTPRHLGCEVMALLLFAEKNASPNSALAQACHWLRLTMLKVHPLQSSYSCDLRGGPVSKKQLVESLDTLLQYTLDDQERAAEFITDAVGWKVAPALLLSTPLARLHYCIIRWNRTTSARTCVRAQYSHAIAALLLNETTMASGGSAAFVIAMLKPSTRSTTTSKGHTTALASTTG